MSRFYIHLMNLEIEAKDGDDAGSIGMLDVTTGHIMNYLGKEFKLVVSTLPITIESPRQDEFPDSLPITQDQEC